MKITLSLIVIFLFCISSSAQSQKISKEEHEKAYQFAISETNSGYPVISKGITTLFKNGKTAVTETSVVEDESQNSHRSKLTILKDGKETIIYQITAGFGNVFCSDDGVKWKPSEYECRNEIRVSLHGLPKAVNTALPPKR